MGKEKRHFFSTTRKIALGFLGLIFLGTILLTMPISSATGKYTHPIDALFTTVTSVCVTGLVTVTTATHWSLFGKVIILILIQLGGLGVICCGIGLLLLIKKRLDLKDRRLIQESYGLDEETGGGILNNGTGKGMKGYDGLIKRIIRGTFIIEGIGAVLLSLRFVPDFGFIKGIWYAVFHSISAFCNAGLDIIGDSSLVAYRGDLLVNLTICFLIITGGIGFIVWWDIIRVIKHAKICRKYKGMLFKRLSLHSKLTITTTIVLIIIGTIAFFVLEYNNPKTLENESPGNKLLMSLFQSVTPRTAGYFTVLQENLNDSSYIITMLLMIIGGSPMGTAGGLKTTTIAMVIACVFSVVKGKKGTEAFGRRIASDNIRTGITVITISMMALVTGIIVLTVIEPFPVKKIAFEAVSAIATVGLGAGMTPFMTAAGKLILIILMYIGRIGPITMAMAFTDKRNSAMDRTELAEKKIILG